MRIRALSPGDREPLAAAIVSSGVFTPVEVRVALEILEAGLSGAAGDAYSFVVAEADGTAIGYACYGSAPLTDRVFDLYWIVVHPEHQGRTVGRALLDAVEAAVRAEDARLLLIETDSKSEYEATRRFYARQGYREVARVHDYYRAGDDKIVYEKRFD